MSSPGAIRKRAQTVALPRMDLRSASCSRRRCGAVMIKSRIWTVAAVRDLTALLRATLSSRIDSTIPGGLLRDGGRLAGEEEPRGHLGIDRIALADPSASVGSVRLIDLDYADAVHA